MNKKQKLPDLPNIINWKKIKTSITAILIVGGVVLTGILSLCIYKLGWNILPNHP